MSKQTKEIEVKFVVHGNCDKEVVGVIISTIKHDTGLKCTVGGFDSFDGIDELSEMPRVVAVLVGNTFDDVYCMFVNDAIICSSEITLRLGVVIDEIERLLSESSAFKIVSLSSINVISEQIRREVIVNATKES